MAKPNDGGPAFPGQQGHLPDGTWNQTFDPGMSLRDCFAVLAPMPPPSWFQPDMPERPESESHKDSISGEMTLTNSSALESWDEEFKQQRCYQWPYHYADTMLEARNG